ncbi:pyrroloquinoline quinone biosynthesis peptide chaperone PqqD [Pseudonocardia acaciae]|uniref:pyrroloquinoline quinone biosynthesis peptide chaperone PqqD n=1 Tax=Pseudonocardia acaciae TaxID=551276 RepID=UPI0005660E1E|nr:pyrroloquinoline quinone biosynthesis peptide chaperone PqqD [Pseudonocardia acaciae]
MEGARPRLRRGVRLGFDRVRGADVLLYPEGVLFPNHTAVAVLRRCDGTATVDEIAADLGGAYRSVDPGQVGELVSRLAERGIVDAGPG